MTDNLPGDETEDKSEFYKFKYENKSPSNLPIAKMISVGVAGALTSVVIWILKAFFDVEMDGGTASALTTVLSFVAGYLTPPQGI